MNTIYFLLVVIGAIVAIMNMRSKISPEYLDWRRAIFNVKSSQTGVSSEEADKVYGVIMDTGKSENLGMTITAFPTGESSLRFTTGGGTIGLGGYPEVADQAKQIISLGQTLLSTTSPTNSQELPKTNNVFFYFLTTSGITRSEHRFEKIVLEEHPYHEIFSKFSMIEQKWMEGESSSGSSSVAPSNGTALGKFIQKVNAENLDKPSEYYFKHGNELKERFEFDDAILDFVKVIRTSSPQEAIYQSAKKQLKELGFSESDIEEI